MVHLKDLSLLSLNIQSGDVFKAIETAIPAEAIEKAKRSASGFSRIANTQAQEERKRALPAQLVVSLVIAMSLWSKDSMRDVLKNLIDGLSSGWVKVCKYWRVPCKSAITQARSAIRCKGDEPIISSISTTNGDYRDIGSVSKWTKNCSH